MRKWTVLFLSALLFFTCVSPCAAEDVPEGTPIYYFYENPCASCHPDAEFITLFNEKLSDQKQLADYHLLLINVFPSGKETLNKVASEIGIPPEEQHTPLLIIKDGWLYGQTAIEEGLQGLFQEQLLPEGAETASPGAVSGVSPPEPAPETVLPPIPEGIPYMRYYYRDSCPDCQRVKPLLEAFEAAHPELRFDRLTVENKHWLEELYQLYSRFQIAEEDWEIPAIFWQDGYLLCDDITDGSLEAAYADTEYHGFADSLPASGSLPALQKGAPLLGAGLLLAALILSFLKGCRHLKRP